MELRDLETAISRLPAEDLTTFARWFEEYLADAWDRRIDADIHAGKLDEAGKRAEAAFGAGSVGRYEPFRYPTVGPGHSR